MRRRRPHRTPKAPSDSPAVRLWILRILVPLNGYRDLVAANGSRNEALAAELGLGDWLDPESKTFDPAPLCAELRRLHQQAERRAMAASLPPHLRSNIDELSGLVGLSATDSRVLEFAVLIQIEHLLSDTADSLGLLTSAKVVYVLSVVLGLPAAEVREALSERGTLARSGLVSVDRSAVLPLSAKLDLLSDQLADLMTSGKVDPIGMLQGTVRESVPGQLGLDDFAHISADLEILRPYLRTAIESGRRGVNIFVYGVPGTGKSELARALASDFRCPLLEVASEDEDGNPVSGERRLRAFRAAQCFFAKSRGLILFDEVDDVFGDGNSLFGRPTTAQIRKPWVNRILEDNPVPTVWIANSIDGLDPAFVRRFDMVFEVPVPPRVHRQRIVRQLCHGLIDECAASRIAEADCLTPAVIAKAAATVRAIDSRLDSGSRSRAVEHLIGRTLSAQGHPGLRADRPGRLSDDYDPALIQTDADLPRLTARLNRTRAGRLCLYGPPGTGKSAFARWLAVQIESGLLVRRASDLISRYRGGSERSVDQAFRQAEREDAVLIIEEIDSLLLDRRGASHAWEVSLANEMLTQMESFTGVLISTTNLIDGLDRAALRRFDLKIGFDYLAPEQSRTFLSRCCTELGLDSPGESDLSVLQALRCLTPGDFRSVMRQHQFRPMGDAAQVVEALRAECRLKDERAGGIGFL